VFGLGLPKSAPSSEGLEQPIEGFSLSRLLVGRFRDDDYDNDNDNDNDNQRTPRPSLLGFSAAGLGFLTERYALAFASVYPARCVFNMRKAAQPAP